MGKRSALRAGSVLLIVVFAVFAQLLVALVAPLVTPVSAGALEIKYDDDHPYDFLQPLCPTCGLFAGVYFSLPNDVSAASISQVSFYYNATSSGGQVMVHITGEDQYVEVVPPVTLNLVGAGWVTVPVSGATVYGNFWVLIEKKTNLKAGVYYDISNDHKSSFYGAKLKALNYTAQGDFLIRVTIDAEYHVGSDQGFRSIQAAVDAAPAGATIYVHDGTYVENVKVNKSLDIRSLGGSAKVTVQAANADDPVFDVTAAQVTLSGFTVQNATGSGESGIYLEQADQCNISDIKISSNISSNDYGITVLNSNSVTVSDSEVSGNSVGINLAGSSHDNVIYNNRIHDNGNGIRIEGANNQVTGNDIYNNSAATGSAIDLGSSASGNLIHFNKILANSDQASGSQAVVNGNSGEAAVVTLNWWGDASGPYHPSANAGGLGDVVGDYVDFQPWLGVSPVAVKSGMATGDPPTLDAKAEASATVIKTGSGTPFIWVASYSENPGGTFPTTAIGKWIDVYFNSTSDVQQVEVRLYYTPEQITGLNEGSLRLYWWDSLNSKWLVCSSSGVDTADDYIWAKITPGSNPGVNSLTDTPFAGGTTSAGFQWWLIPVVLIVLVVLAVAARLVYAIVIKGARPADAE